MPKRRLTRAESQAQTREALLAAALRVFARRGFQAATIAAIAEEAGYSHGAVYSNFAGKDDLFLAVYERWIATNMSQLRGAMDEEGSLAERARSAADEWMARFADDPEPFLLRLELAVRAARDPSLLELLGTRADAVPQTTSELLEQSESEGEIELRLPAYELALGFDALILGLALKALSDERARRPGLLGDLVALLLQATTTSPERRTRGKKRATS
jgi:AcrR family transcriptional regulator